MRKPRVYLILVGLLLAGGVVALVFDRAREPEYGGKKLSEWVTSLEAFHRSDDPVRKEAEEAIRHIGPRAVPYLVHWLCWEPSPWFKKMPRFVAARLERLAPNTFASDHAKQQRRSWGSCKA